MNCCSQCKSTHACQTQDDMTRNHGTPKEFRDACAKTIGEISLDEYETAVRTYEKDWCRAPGRTHPNFRATP